MSVARSIAASRDPSGSIYLSSSVRNEWKPDISGNIKEGQERHVLSQL